MSSLPLNRLRLRSYLAPNMAFFYEGIAHYLARAFAVDIEFDQSLCDPLDDRGLQQGEIDIAFICGLPLVRLQAQGVPLTVLSAPVLDDPRVAGKPVYFADVIVHRDSAYHTLSDLQGAAFCYNDPGSNSGHYLLRHHLLTQGCHETFFGRTAPSGSHQASIRRVVEGQADCATIDSAVLAQALRDRPELKAQLRVVDSIGPCPIPPIALGSSRLYGAEATLRHALSEPDETLTRIMTQAGITALAPVSDADYAPIYRLFTEAETTGYALIEA